MNSIRFNPQVVQSPSHRFHACDAPARFGNAGVVDDVFFSTSSEKETGPAIARGIDSALQARGALLKPQGDLEEADNHYKEQYKQALNNFQQSEKTFNSQNSKDAVLFYYNWASAQALVPLVLADRQTVSGIGANRETVKTAFANFENKLETLCHLPQGSMKNYFTLADPQATCRDGEDQLSRKLRQLAILLKPTFSNSEIATIFCTYGWLNGNLWKQNELSNSFLSVSAELDSSFSVSEDISRNPDYPFLRPHSKMADSTQDLTPQERYEVSKTAFKAGQLEEACLDGLKLLEKEPNDIPALILTGSTYAKLAKNASSSDIKALYAKRGLELLYRAIRETTGKTEKDVKSVTNLIIAMMNRDSLVAENPVLNQWSNAPAPDLIDRYLDDILDRHYPSNQGKIISQHPLQDIIKSVDPRNLVYFKILNNELSTSLLAALFHNFAIHSVFSHVGKSLEAYQLALQLDHNLKNQWQDKHAWGNLGKGQLPSGKEKPDPIYLLADEGTPVAS